MNTRRLLFLSALCLTMGTTQVSAQSFLKKIKNKGTQIIKEAAPKPVKEVMDAVDNANKAPKNNTSANRSGNRTTQSRSTQRTRTNTNRRPSTRNQADFEPAHKTITIKLYKGLGIKTWLGRKAFNTPQPPMQCPKQPAWIDALPHVIELDNASLIAESKMINKWVEADKPSCEPVLVRRELLDSEVGDRIRALDNAIHYLNNASRAIGGRRIQTNHAVGLFSPLSLARRRNRGIPQKHQPHLERSLSESVRGQLVTGKQNADRRDVVRSELSTQ